MSASGIVMPDLQIVGSALGADIVPGSAAYFLNSRVQTLAVFDQTLMPAAMSDAADRIFSSNGCSIPHGVSSIAAFRRACAAMADSS